MRRRLNIEYSLHRSRPILLLPICFLLFLLFFSSVIFSSWLTFSYQLHYNVLPCHLLILQTRPEDRRGLGGLSPPNRMIKQKKELKKARYVIILEYRPPPSETFILPPACYRPSIWYELYLYNSYCFHGFDKTPLT